MDVRGTMTSDVTETLTSDITEKMMSDVTEKMMSNATETMMSYAMETMLPLGPGSQLMRDVTETVQPGSQWRSDVRHGDNAAFGLTTINPATTSLAHPTARLIAIQTKPLLNYLTEPDTVVFAW